MLKRLSTIPIVFALSSVLSTLASANDAGDCQKYANLAMKDALYATRCSAIPRDDARWRNDRNYHYQWCMSVSPSASAAESEARRQALIECGIIYSNTPR